MSTTEIPIMKSTDQISEDTLQYLREKRVPEIMEYILRNIIQEKPERPLTFIKDLTSAPLPPRIMIVGPPASGKGTQCQQICAFYRKKNKGRSPVHISSGDLLREATENGTHDGLIAEGYMKEGHLVPDSLIIGMIRRRLHEKDAVLNGWLLDGFPRNRAQAEALDAEGFSPELLIILDVPDDFLIERVEGRRLDPSTGAIYHLKFNPPPQEDVALLDRLECRPDDSREVLIPRLQEYHQFIDNVLEHYGAVSVRIDGNRPDGDVTDDIIEVLEKSRFV